MLTLTVTLIVIPVQRFKKTGITLAMLIIVAGSIGFALASVYLGTAPTDAYLIDR
jgi:hypothetical protein